MSPAPPYILAGIAEPPHLGAHLLNAGRGLGLDISFADVQRAYRAPRWVSRIYWHLLDKRPPRLREFRRSIAATQSRVDARGFLGTGVCPLDARGLAGLGRAGVIRANFSTDDPWNPANGARWFLRALREYDVVFTPRRANIADFRRIGCPRVEYLPFAFEPTVHFPEPPDPRLADRFGCDVAFVGGGDADRLPYVDALAEAGLRVRVFGGGWDRVARWRPRWGGAVIDGDYRQAVAHARVQLCLVRRANRDGHVMRSFELPAMRSCILAEDTPEHRDIYGPPEDENVAYFSGPHDLAAAAKRCLEDGERRDRMAARVFERVVERSHNTYRDRLASMVNVIESERSRRGRG
ncbi:MAG: glycosyltransferase [Polyangiaceae bacterium]|jgi:hypothetical protein